MAEGQWKQGFAKKVTEINMKTSSFLELQKIKTYIGTLESEIFSLQSEIGSQVYTMWKNEGINLSEVEDLLTQIDSRKQLLQEQNRLTEEIKERDNAVLGTRVGTAAQTVSGQGCVCPNCGEVYAVSINFCKKCGTKMK